MIIEIVFRSGPDQLHQDPDNPMQYKEADHGEEIDLKYSSIISGCCGIHPSEQNWAITPKYQSNHDGEEFSPYFDVVPRLF